MGSPQTALSLAVLADSVGHVVSKTDLVDALWGRYPPRQGPAALHPLMSRLRGALRAAGFRDDVVVSRGPGYFLNVDPRCVDRHRVTRLVSTARENVHRGHRDEAARLYDEALRQWDGDPLARVGGDWAEARRLKMRADRLRVLAQWAENALELGGYEELLDRLEDHPVRERLVYLRMRALKELKRDSEAIDCYHVLRDHRLEHSGLEPNEQTRRLYEELIRRETLSLRPAPPDSPPPAAGSAPAPGPVVVDTLPHDLGDFTAREQEVRLILDGAEHGGSGTVVQVIRGLGGVGKSVLALHVAHRLRHRFDFRLHLDLRGIDTEQALFHLLRVLGVPGEAVPPGLDRRVEMWRTGTAERRVLLVLDDAVPGQVAPLIPASPGGVVLVTTRENLVVELDGARDLRLRPPSDDDGIRMLAAFESRLAEDEGIADLAAMLGNLPLALRLTAAQLRIHPGRGCRTHADRIARNGLSEVDGTHRGLDATFDISYANLSPVARRVFLCAGLHPVANLRLPAVAASVGGRRETEAAFEELLDRHLVEETADEAYRMHDLVRRFARERAHEVMTEPERRAADLRVLDHYLHTADAADRAARPGRFRLGLPMIGRTAEESFSGPKEARDWFVDAFADLDEVLSFAREQGYTAHVAWLPLAMSGLLDGCGPWDRAERALDLAVEAWRGLGAEEGVAHALYERGCMRERLFDLGGARKDIDSAKARWEAVGDTRGAAYAHDRLGTVYAVAREYGKAMREHRASLLGFQGTGDRWGRAQVFNHIGVVLRRTGDLEGATRMFAITASLSEELGDDRTRAQAMLNDAGALLHLGFHREARIHCEESRRLFEESGDRMNAALARNNHGMVLNYLQRYRDALECFMEARERYRVLGYGLGELRADTGSAEALLGLGRVAEAQRAVEDALPRARGPLLGDLEPVLFNLLGDVHLERRRFSMARLQYQNARQLARARGNPVTEGLACDHLGDLCVQEGDIGRARKFWQEALQMLEPLKVYQVDMIRVKLDGSAHACDSLFQ